MSNTPTMPELCLVKAPAPSDPDVCVIYHPDSGSYYRGYQAPRWTQDIHAASRMTAAHGQAMLRTGVVGPMPGQPETCFGQYGLELVPAPGDLFVLRHKNTGVYYRSFFRPHWTMEPPAAKAMTQALAEQTVLQPEFVSAVQSLVNMVNLTPPYQAPVTESAPCFAKYDLELVPAALSGRFMLRHKPTGALYRGYQAHWTSKPETALLMTPAEAEHRVMQPVFAEAIEALAREPAPEPKKYGQNPDGSFTLSPEAYQALRRMMAFRGRASLNSKHTHGLPHDHNADIEALGKVILETQGVEFEQYT